MIDSVKACRFAIFRLAARAVALVIAICAAVAPIQGQSTSASGVLRQYPTRAPATHGLSIHADYDPQFDKTVLRLDPVALDSTLRVSALVALDGREVRKEAPGVVLTFWSTFSKKRFQTNRAVTLRVNDDPPMLLAAAELTPTPKPGFSEVMMTSLSLDQWLQLASARRARLIVGTYEYALSPSLLAAVRDFASRMAPVKPTQPSRP